MIGNLINVINSLLQQQNMLNPLDIMYTGDMLLNINYKSKNSFVIKKNR